jgi:hypothetical protein
MIGATTLATPALAGSIYQWHWEPGSPGEYVYNDRGGAVNSADATYDAKTGRLSWSANFGPPSANPDRLTNGFTLALNAGGDPVGFDGQLAMLYFDATAASPIMSVYGYNGTPLNDSWRDGGSLFGTQPPDQIVSSVNDTSWIIDMFVQDELDGSRTMGFEIDTSTINAHDPLYGTPAEWEGIAFGEELGIWFHPYAELSTAYGDDGYLSDWEYLFENRGWLDANGLPTVIVPLPPAVLLGLAGLLGVAVIRRR